MDEKAGSVAITGTLKNWHIVKSLGDPSTHKIKHGFQIIGELHDDERKRWLEGETITTSLLKCVDFQNGLAFTLNSVYRLA